LKFTRLFFLIIVSLLVNWIAASGQGNVGNQKPVADTLRRGALTPLNSPKDNDSLAILPINSAAGLIDTTKKSKSQLDFELKTSAEDSTTFSNDKETTYFHKNARVSYGDFQLDADYIEVNKKMHTIFARGSIDPKTKRYVGRPISKQGDESPITTDSIAYNYETKKAYVWNPFSEQEGNYLSGGRAKKINETETALKDQMFSTCDKPDHPHFGIVITWGIVEKKRIISGPAYLKIEGVPIPIGIPFGFFPKMNTRTSGVILPTFGEDQRLGFFLRNFGYYLGLSDYADLTTMGTYFSNGSFEVNSTLNYRNRYKYSGNLSLSYGAHNYGLQGDPAQKDFNITWSHSKNPNSRPGTTFSASVNAGTSTFYKNNAATANFNLQALTQNNFRSSIAYGKNWAGTPFNLTVSLSHSQDLTKKTVTMDLPTLNFSMATISPFDSKTRVTAQKWYQRITVGYTLAATNKLNNIPESELFTQKTLTKRMQNGIQHQIPVGMNLNLLKYFQFNTNLNYLERWYFQSVRKRYARADSLVTDTVPGFQRVGEYGLGAGVSTKVYGLLNFKKGSIQAIRHVMTPNIGFAYRPDYSSFDHSYNRSIVSSATIPYPVISQRYSIFEKGIFGYPTGGRQAGLNISVENNLEAKMRPKSTDTSTVDRKIQLLQGLTFSTFYNFAADSFKLSPISFSGHTTLFKGKLAINFGGVLNPYTVKVIDTINNGVLGRYPRPVNRFSWQDGRFPMLASFNVSTSLSLNSSAFKGKGQPVPIGSTLQSMDPEQAQRLSLMNGDPAAYIDFNIPWNVNLSYNFSYSNQVVSTQIANTLMINGDVSITKNWKIQYNTNLDIRALKVSSATSFAIYRNLHCWSLSVQWLPFGFYKSYNVTLRVNSTILQDLKLSKRSDYTANQFNNR
jgi:lipopolysaccharide assembly outer membrane protein LptD (OstA)